MDSRTIRNTAYVRQCVPFIISIVPPLYLIAVVLTRTVDVPFADQWALVPLLEHVYRGELSFAELWAQHNEHRLLFPRLLMLGLALLTGWNTQYEMLASIGLAAGLFGLLIYQVRGTGLRTRMPWSWLAPVLSLAVFSLNQAENWWGGWNMQIYLNVLAVGGAIVLLSQPCVPWPAFGVALACGVVATYSYSSGLLVWFIGIALLVLQSAGLARRNVLQLAAWLSVGAAAAAAFFYQYKWTGQVPNVADILGNPGRYLTYAITYLGAPPTRGAVEYVFGLLTGDTRAICNLGDSDLCAYVNNAAMAAGISAALLFPVAIGMLLRKQPIQMLLPYIGLVLYAAGAALFTSLGRASYGNYQALAQRYATIASLFWIALVVILSLCIHLYRHRWRLAALAVCIMLVFVALTTLSTLQGLDHFQWHQAFLAPARDELFLLQNDELLLRLYFDPDVVKEAAPMLRQYRLSVFR